ncbi:hypothetical protein [Methylobacterium radiotolerans]|uniref:hypothetical protein n=1 Tax=Methylobacterium radiotolerans TaxID=31998 RepID=UPI0038CFF404
MAGELITLESAKKSDGAADEAGPDDDRGPSRFRSLRTRFPQVVDARIVSVAAAGLALGTVLGVATAPRDGSREMAMTLKAEIAGLKEDVARLSGTAGGSTDALARIREQLDAAAGMATRTEASAADRGDRLEKLLSARFAEAKADRERSERDFGSSLGSIAEKIGKAVPSAAATTPAAVVQPATTGAIPHAVTAPDQVTDWALREVQDGVAVIEDRKHRVLEIAKGDVVPGLGRVESVERRGRDWVVTTGKGAIVPRDW